MRVNLYGGPSVGKSALAARLFSELKAKHYNVELVREFVKDWAFIGRQVNAFDQVPIFGEQFGRENLPLSSGVEHVITDSPLLLSAFYGKKYGFPGWEAFLELVRPFEQTYPSINFFLLRGQGRYEERGRYQTEEQAREVDKELLAFLREWSVDLTLVGPDPDPVSCVLELIECYIGIQEKKNEQERANMVTHDKYDEALEHTFPASDPPACPLLTAVGPPANRG